jgi:hypothetical protein
MIKGAVVVYFRAAVAIFTPPVEQIIADHIRLLARLEKFIH